MCVASQRPPLPLTVKLPVRLFTVMPLVGPLAAVPALIFVKVNAPVAVLMFTAVPVVEVTALKVKLLAPLLAITTAPPLVELILLKVTPVVEVSALQLIPFPLVVVMLFVPLTLTMPPPVAVNESEVSVLVVMPPLNVITAPVLLVSVMPVSLSVTCPLKDTLPPVMLLTLTE